jgi:hypothetical protein
MRISPPALVIYGRSTEEALEVILRRQLRHTEIFTGPIMGLHFSHSNDLLLFAIRMDCEVLCEGCLAIIPPRRAAEARESISEMILRARVETVELLGIWFYDTEEQDVMDQEFGLKAAVTNATKTSLLAATQPQGW